MGGGSPSFRVTAIGGAAAPDIASVAKAGGVAGAAASDGVAAVTGEVPTG